MRLLVLAFVLFASPAAALPVAFEFTGSLPVGGTLTGSFTYDTESSPLASNVRGMQNNTYTLTDWSFTATPNNAILPYKDLPESIVFNPSTSTYEFCVPQCVFASAPSETLMFSDGIHSLRLSFSLSGMELLNSAPSSIEQWGPLWPNASQLVRRTDATDAGFQYEQVVIAGELRAVSVPEPASWVLLATALMWLVGWKTGRRQTA